jgi:hypothetical protein
MLRQSGNNCHELKMNTWEMKENVYQMGGKIMLELKGIAKKCGSCRRKIYCKVCKVNLALPLPFVYL